MSPGNMASLVLGALCAVMLSACSGEAAMPFRQFQEVTQTTTAAMTPTAPTTLPPRQCVLNGVEYPIGAIIRPPSDPCRVCYCIEPGIIHCRRTTRTTCPAELPQPCVDFVLGYQPGQCCPSRTCPNGRNCRNPDGGSPIPDGQAVIVNGQLCYCLVAMLPSGTYNTEVMCPVTSP
ncbi:uncharacterized protein LOC144872167 [Branchiostoma floridae x Branchiostoma japonicum]